MCEKKSVHQFSCGVCVKLRGLLKLHYRICRRQSKECDTEVHLKSVLRTLTLTKKQPKAKRIAYCDSATQTSLEENIFSFAPEVQPNSLVLVASNDSHQDATPIAKLAAEADDALLKEPILDVLELNESSVARPQGTNVPNEDVLESNQPSVSPSQGTNEPNEDVVESNEHLVSRLRRTIHINISQYEPEDNAIKPRANTCKVCRKKYSSLKALRRHQSREHANVCMEKTNQKQSNVNPQVNQVNIEPDVKPEIKHIIKQEKHIKTYNCNICQKEFSRSRDLTQHRKSVHDVEADNALIAQFRTSSGDLNCSYCGASFKHKATFLKHLRRHTKAKPYLCDTCGAAYASQGALNTHLKEHSGNDLHPCKICNKVFATATRLLVHARIHTGEKPFSCEYCGRSFSNISGLKPHLRLHTGEKPFKCHLCDYASTVKAGLRQHMVNHGQAIIYTCTLCDKKFRFKAKYTAHMMMHSGERRHFCSICNRGFFYANELKKHVNTVHSAERPFKCDYCDQTYKRKTHLTRHMMSSHKLNPVSGDASSLQQTDAYVVIKPPQLEVPPPPEQKTEIVVVSHPLFAPTEHTTIETLQKPQNIVTVTPCDSLQPPHMQQMHLVPTEAYLYPTAAVPAVPTTLEQPQNLSQPKIEHSFSYVENETIAESKQPPPAPPQQAEVDEYDTSGVTADWYAAALANAVHYSQVPLQ